MSQIVAGLFRELAGDAKQFMVISQGNASSRMKHYSAVSGRFRFAFLTGSSGSATLADVSGITQVIFSVWNATGDFITKVIPGPFPQIDNTQWNNGLNPTAQHLLVELTGDELALEPGTYTLSVYGNDDALGGNDFYVECELEILETGITEVFVQPNTDESLYQALLLAVMAKLGDYAKKIGAPGERIALTTIDVAPAGPFVGKYGRIWLAAVWSPDGDLVLDQYREAIDQP